MDKGGITVNYFYQKRLELLYEDKNKLFQELNIINEKIEEVHQLKQKWDYMIRLVIQIVQEHYPESVSIFTIIHEMNFRTKGEIQYISGLIEDARQFDSNLKCLFGPRYYYEFSKVDLKKYKKAEIEKLNESIRKELNLDRNGNPIKEMILDDNDDDELV